VLHALDLREEIAMRAFELSEAEVRRQRRKAAQRVYTALEEMIVHAGASLREAAPWIGFGDAAMVVLARERALRAELLVIGKRKRSVLTDFFLGSVTQRVLAATRADVLVLPRGGDAAATRTGGAAAMLRADPVR
jgi:nucleotide-binding universal stress UspA family protein